MLFVYSLLLFLSRSGAAAINADDMMIVACVSSMILLWFLLFMLKNFLSLWPEVDSEAHLCNDDSASLSTFSYTHTHTLRHIKLS